ncbi:MAG: hypothetical protein IJ702_04320 [Fretibacterium sp.]|nr:hypothetical protein [Fretibacterium sp.]
MQQILNTGNKTLDKEILLLTAQELDELARYAGYLRKSRTQDSAWADAPLTSDEEQAVMTGRENVKIGDCLTLDEFRKKAALL